MQWPHWPLTCGLWNSWKGQKYTNTKFKDTQIPKYKIQRYTNTKYTNTKYKIQRYKNTEDLNGFGMVADHWHVELMKGNLSWTARHWIDSLLPAIQAVWETKIQKYKKSKTQKHKNDQNYKNTKI